MCPRCEGMGSVTDLDLAQLFDESKSLSEGAITVPGYTGGGWNSRMYSASGFYDPDKPIRDFTKTELHDFLHREPTRMKDRGHQHDLRGTDPRIQKSMLAKDKEAMQPHIRRSWTGPSPSPPVPNAAGPASARAHAPRRSMPSASPRLRHADQRLGRMVRGLDAPSVAPLLDTLRQTLDSFAEIAGVPLA